MERPPKRHKNNKFEASVVDQTGFTSLPLEIIFKIFDEYPVHELYDLVRLSFSCSFLCNIFRQTTYWIDRYYKSYDLHDELSSDEQPTYHIKLFLWSFLPADYETNSNGYDWCYSYRQRFIYDEALLHAINACQSRERSGWKPLEPTDNNNYHKHLSKDTFRFGFRFYYESVFGLLHEVPHPPTQAAWLQKLLNLPGMVDISSALDLCLLQLTFDAFTEDPTATLISVIDPFHFNKAYNPHVAHAHHLCSLYVPVSDPALQPEEAYCQEPVIMPSENIEIAEYGLRRWGFYTNCYNEGLLWGDQLNALLENKYRSEWLFDASVFTPCDYITNFNDLRQ